MGDETPLATAVHNGQVVDPQSPTSTFDTITDYAVTTTRVIEVFPKKAKGIHWSGLQKGMLEEIPPLSELETITKR